MFVINPKSGRKIKINGKVYNNLIKEGIIFSSIIKKDEKDNKKEIPREILIPKLININKTITKICHISDIHIPLKLNTNGRKQEYLSVFENLYTELRKINDISLIIMTGDMLNTKIKLEPETIIMARNFLKNLAKIAPVVIIAGNHDTNETNADRVDTLTAICVDIGNIEYFKLSGLYQYKNITFVVSSLIDKHFIRMSDINVKWNSCKLCDKRFKQAGNLKNHLTDAHNIGVKWKPYDDMKYYALYHGTLSGCKLASGMILSSLSSSRYRTVADFIDFDAVLLGDIHMPQEMKSNIAYAGSLIQVNFGESPIKHGYLLWDTETDRSSFFPVKNEYAALTLHADNGEIDPKEIEFSKTFQSPRIRIQYQNTGSSAKIKLESAIREEIKPSLLRTENIRQKKITIKNSSTNIEDLIKIYSPDHSDDLIKLHKRLDNSLIVKSTGNVWTIKRLTFKNIFSYGGSRLNVINFKNGIISICSPNTYGKSSIVHMIMFILTDKTSHNTSSKSNILNFNEKSGFMRLEIAVNGIDYDIKKQCTSYGKKHKYVTSIFKNENGKSICCNGTSQTETKKFIRRLVGDFDDIVTNNLICHTISRSLIYMTPTEKFRFINRIIGSDKFIHNIDTCKKLVKKMINNLTKNKIKKTHIEQFILQNPDVFIKNRNIIDSGILILTKEYKKLQEREKKAKIAQEKILKLTRSLKDIGVPFDGISESPLEHNIPLHSLLYKIQRIEKVVDEMKYDALPDDSTIEDTSEYLINIDDKIHYKVEKVDVPLAIIFLRLPRIVDNRLPGVTYQKAISFVKNTRFFNILAREKTKLTKEYLEGFTIPNLIFMPQNVSDDVFKNLAEGLKYLEGLSRDPTPYTGPKNIELLISNIQKIVREKNIKNIKNNPELFGKRKALNFPLTHNIFRDWSKFIQTGKIKSSCKEAITQIIQNPAVYIHALGIDKKINFIEFKRAELNKYLLLRDRRIKYDNYLKYIKLKERLSILASSKINNILQDKVFQMKDHIETVKMMNIFNRTLDKIINHNKKISHIKRVMKGRHIKNIIILKGKFNAILQLSIEQNKKIRLEIDELKKISINMSEIKAVLDQISDLKMKLAEVIRRINDHNQSEQKLIPCEKEIRFSESQITLYKEYIDIFSPGKIPSDVLRSNIEIFVDIVNDVFGQHTGYNFAVNENTKQIKFNVISQTSGAHMEPERLSGFESLILMISINQAISTMSTDNHGEFLIIDEAFDVIDANRFDIILPQIAVILRFYYKTILLISHRDLPTEISDGQIRINKDENGNSFIF